MYAIRSYYGGFPGFGRGGEPRRNLVRAAEREGLLDCGANPPRLDRASRGDERDVGEVLDPRVRARARHRVGSYNFV